MRLIRHGMPIVLEQTEVAGVKADLVKNVIRVTIDFPLTDETLDLRKRLAVMAKNPGVITPVEVTLQPMRYQTDNYQIGFAGLSDEADPETGELPFDPPTAKAETN